MRPFRLVLPALALAAAGTALGQVYDTGTPPEDTSLPPDETGAFEDATDPTPEEAQGSGGWAAWVLPLLVIVAVLGLVGSWVARRRPDEARTTARRRG